MLDPILDLVGQPPGSLVYHFIILFALEAALAIVTGQWMRERSPNTARLTIGIGVIFAARALVLIAGLLAWRGFLPRNVLLPPVERAVDTITLLGMAWSFITMDDPAILKRNFWPDMIASALLGMSVAGFVGTYYYWFFSASSGQLFNGLWLDVLWTGMQVIIAAAGLIWMITRVRYVYDPFLKGIMLIGLGAASAIHLIQFTPGDVAAPLRVGQIVVMPMLAAVAYRHVVEQLLHWDEFEPSARESADEVPAAVSQVPTPPHPITPEPITPPPPDTIAETARANVLEEAVKKPVSPTMLVELVDTLGGLLTTLDQRGVMQEATKAVATALHADMCVLAVVDETTHEAGVLAGYDNITQAALPQAVVGLSDQPGIVNALGRLRQMRLTPQRNQKELRELFRSVGISPHVGPAYIQPLVDGDERIGVIIVGSPYSERALSEDERNLLDRLGPLVSAAMLNAERFELARDENEQVMMEEGARLASLADEVTAARSELDAAQRQNEEMRQYIRDMHRQLEATRGSDPEEMTRLQAEIVRLTSQTSDTGELQRRYDDLRERYDRLAQEHRGLEEKASDAQPAGPDNGNAMNPAERSFYERQIEELRASTNTEIASLRVRLAQASISQQEVMFLQEQLAVKAREVIGIKARLTEAQAVAEALREQIEGGAGSELRALQSHFETQAGEVAALREQLAEVQAHAIESPEARQAEADAEALDQEAVAELEAKLAERADLIEMLQEQLSEKSRGVSTLRDHMSDVESSLRNLENQLSHKTDEIADLQDSLADTRQQARDRIAELQARIDAGIEEGSAVQAARIEMLEAELAEKATAVEVLEGQLQNTTAAMRGLENQLRETQDAVDAVISEARQDDSHNEVIASLAQELRTPMSSITGYTELLLRETVGILGALQRKFLLRVKANTERMGVLLDDLIRITAMDTGQLELSAERVDVTYAVEEVIMNVASQYREKGLTLRMRIDPRLPALTADRDIVLQVLGHLLTNAGLASPVEGEVQLLVTSRQDRVPAYEDYDVGCLYVTVEDSGGGIASEDIDQVFTRKYKADSPLIEGLGDTGVSLSLAKELVDAHGGRLWLESQNGTGTVFHLLLPLQAPYVEDE